MEIPTHTSGQPTRSDLLGYTREFVNALSEVREHTRRSYARSLRAFLHWCEEDGRFLFAVDDVYRYRHYLLRAKNLAPASVSTYMTSVRLLCAYLHRRGIIPYNPARHVRGPRVKKTAGPICLQKNDVARLLASVDKGGRRGLRDSALLRLMVYNGLTEVELVDADAGDFVFIDGSGALRLRSGDVVSRVVLDQATASCIRDYLALRGTVQRQQPLFLSDGNRSRGMRMTTRGIRERVNRYLRAAGLKEGVSGATAHSLRHTAAQLMADAGAPPDEIRYRMRFGSLARAKKYIERTGQGVHT